MHLYRFLSCVPVVGAVSLATVLAVSPARAAAAPRLTEEPFIDVNAAAMAIKPSVDIDADSDEGGHRFQFDRGHHSNLMAAMLASSRGPVLVMS
jgi:hypothetical protein